MQNKLEQTLQALECWRSTKEPGRRIIPNELKAQAVALLGDFTAREIIDTLRLNGSQFKKWRETFKSGDIPLTEQVDFIPVTLPPNEEKKVGLTPSLEINLTLPNTSHISIKGELTAELLHVLLQEASGA